MTAAGGNLASVRSPSPRAFFNFDTKEQTGGGLALFLAALVWIPPALLFLVLQEAGMGAVAVGQAVLLAPFNDRNGDGVYDPGHGDYPAIRGDRGIFFLCNDDFGPHTESQGERIGAEVHGQAYAYDAESTGSPTALYGLTDGPAGMTIDYLTGLAVNEAVSYFAPRLARMLG